MEDMKKQLSKCCKAEIEVNLGDEGTNCWLCGKCKKPCNVFITTTHPCLCDICLKARDSELSRQKQQILRKVEEIIKGMKGPVRNIHISSNKFSALYKTLDNGYNFALADLLAKMKEMK